jgi:hypothetical protein
LKERDIVARFELFFWTTAIAISIFSILRLCGHSNDAASEMKKARHRFQYAPRFARHNAKGAQHSMVGLQVRKPHLDLLAIVARFVEGASGFPDDARWRVDGRCEADESLARRGRHCADGTHRRCAMFERLGVPY